MEGHHSWGVGKNNKKALVIENTITLRFNEEENIGGVAKSPIYSVAAVFPDLDLPYVEPVPLKENALFMRESGIK